MKLNKEFKLNVVSGEGLLVKAGGREADLTKVYSLNGPAAWLYEAIADREFEIPDLVKLLCSEYEVDEETAAKDISALLDDWKRYGIVL